jgi:hypothetical protein
MTKMIDSMLQRFGTAPTIGTATGTSLLGSYVSFAESTLPLVSWMAAFIGILSGIVGLAIGIRVWVRGSKQQ